MYISQKSTFPCVILVISCALITAGVSLIMDLWYSTQLSTVNDSFCLLGTEVIMSSSGDIPVVIVHGLDLEVRRICQQRFSPPPSSPSSPSSHSSLLCKWVVSLCERSWIDLLHTSLCRPLLFSTGLAFTQPKSSLLLLWDSEDATEPHSSCAFTFSWSYRLNSADFEPAYVLTLSYMCMYMINTAVGCVCTLCSVHSVLSGAWRLSTGSCHCHPLVVTRKRKGW